MFNRLQIRLFKTSHSICYFVVWGLLYLTFRPFVSIQLQGKENIPKRGRYILAANHQNFFDGFFASFAHGPFRRVTFIIAKRALKYRVYHFLARLIGCVVIGSNVEEYQRILKKLNNILLHGGKVGIFPEGNVSKNNIPGKFKGGVAKLSIDSRSKVIPVFLSGTYQLRHFKSWFTRPKISIRIGKPVALYNYAESCDNNLDQVSSILRAKIVELMDADEQEKSLRYTASTPRPVS